LVLSRVSQEDKETKINEALKLFDIAIEKGYDEANVYITRGMCLYDLKFYFDALEDYNRGIDRKPNNGIANNYYYRSMIKYFILDFDGSLADIKEAIYLSKLDNEDNKWWNNHAKTLGFNTQTELYELDKETAERKLDREKRAPRDKETELKTIKRRTMIDTIL
jgi:tetratricopeptide (TPR) repeat protein